MVLSKELSATQKYKLNQLSEVFDQVYTDKCFIHMLVYVGLIMNTTWTITYFVLNTKAQTLCLYQTALS